MNSTAIILIVESTVVVAAILWWERDKVRNAWLDITYFLWYKRWAAFSTWSEERKQAKLRRSNDRLTEIGLIEIIKTNGIGGEPVPTHLPDEVYQAFDLLLATINVPNEQTKWVLVREARARLERIINR